MVGDPSGRSDERNLLDDDTLNHNVAAIKSQLARIVDLGAGGEARTGRQPRLDAADHGARVPPRRRQTRHGQSDAGAREHQAAGQLRARHLVHRVQLHAAAGQRLPVAARQPGVHDPDRRVRPVGQHHRRRRSDPPQARRARARLLVAAADRRRRHQARQDHRVPGCGSTPPRPARTSSANTGCRRPTSSSSRNCSRSRSSRSSRSRPSSPNTVRRRTSASGSGRSPTR
jgi:hypothetical protein